MGVITETEPGGEIVCILEFSARPRGDDLRPASEKRRIFRVGQRVRYVGSFHKPTPEDNPTGPMVVLQPLDPRDRNRYAATQDYFVTLDCWEGIRRHIASTLVVADQEALAGPIDAATHELFKLVPIPSTSPRPGRAGAKVPKSSPR